MILAIDFDRVIHDVEHPAPGRKMGPPIEGAAEGVWALINDGHTVVVHTLRGDKPQHVVDWLAYFGFPPGLEVTNIKPDADWFVDDRALRFTGWEQTLQELA